MNVVVKQIGQYICSGVIIVYLASDLILNAVYSATILKDYYANIEFVGSALKESFDHFACTTFEGFLHHLGFVRNNLLDFLN